MARNTIGLRNLSYSNVMSTLAVFLVIGGGAAVAATTIGKNDVRSKQVKNNTLRSADLADNKGVTGQDVTDDSLKGADIDESSLSLGAGAQGPAGAPGEPGAPATRLFAHVSTVGVLGPAQGATAAGRASTGNYTVTFNRDLAGCIALVAPGLVRGAGFDSFTAGTKTSTTINDAAPSTVNVQLFGSGGTGPIDGGFNLAVFC